jgi:thiol-disulfide isomerase/thioredoxin
MAETPSTMLALGTHAPAFRLSDSDGNVVALEDFAAARALLVMFICPHCPFVRHVRSQLAAVARDYAGRGLASVAVMSNDVAQFPQDGLEGMRREKLEAGYVFPYLYDETQEVAKAYRAACTPDLFLFDEERRLVYRGQLDGSRPGNAVPVDGRDLRSALDAVLDRRPVDTQQRASIGCNIKWKPGNAPDYFGS